MLFIPLIVVVYWVFGRVVAVVVLCIRSCVILVLDRFGVVVYNIDTV